MMTAYYNEFDPNAAAWLRELIKQGLIANGIVDERSIINVQASDLYGFTQHHFFAGIGGWSRSLRLANWQDDKPVWTVSLPCQPFSTAGKQQGKADERHLLPHFLELVKQCRPDTLFGEQVEAAIRHGWLDDLQAAMEAENYAVGYCVLGAHSVNSFHQRQRLYWVAKNRFSNANIQRQQRQREMDRPLYSAQDKNWKIHRIIGYCNNNDRLGNAQRNGQSTNSLRPSPFKFTGWLRQFKRPSTCEWDNPDWLYCRDGKYRAIEPSIKPLVNGLPKGMVYSSDSSAPTNPNETQEARVMRLKGYGNAIVPQVAAEFIRAFIELQR